LRELALHLLDIAHNSVSAKARDITITVIEDTQADRLHMSVEDDGVGMDTAALQRVTDPFETSRTTRNVGLGIPLLKAAAESCNGFLTITSQPGVGTQLDVEFQRSHIDRMPLGNIAETILTLVVGCPDIHWRFVYSVDQETFEFDDMEFKNELEGISLSEPAILSYLRGYIEQGVAQTQSTLITI
jgi:anti-sigma regulatory factor (Ser/Thr protein kinase)